MSYERWYENLPFGPLTEEAHKGLSLAYYDGGGINDTAKYAKRRGIDQNDYLRSMFAKLDAKPEAGPMSEQNTSSSSQDPSLAAGNRVDFREVDMYDPEIVAMLKKDGELFRRKIEAVKGVREPETVERVDTVVNGIVESTRTAEPGKHKIITGSRGEEFVFTNEKYADLYTVDNEGNVTPRERFVLAMRNPYGQPIRIEAPWSTPEDYQTQDGTAEAMLTFGLDDSGELTADRYLIGDREMLLNNYEPEEESEPELEARPGHA